MTGPLDRPPATFAEAEDRGSPPTLPARVRTPRGDDEAADRSDDSDARELGAANRMLMRRLDRALDQSAAGFAALKTTIEAGDARVAGSIETQMGRMVLVVQIGGALGLIAALIVVVMLILILSGVVGVDPAAVAGGTSTVVTAGASAVQTATGNGPLPPPAQPVNPPPPPVAPDPPTP